jgi:acyl-coenzyme A thioesterase PaaI-like protein
MGSIASLASHMIWRSVKALRELNLKLAVNLYPPYLGAGIRVEHISPDFRSIRVAMPLTFYNRNYVGTHFGGSLYAMCDPFFMLMVIKNLGPDFIVWDKAGSIRFLHPGRGTVRAHFVITPEQLAALRNEAQRNGTAQATFAVDVVDGNNQAVARVEKVIHVRSRVHTSDKQ